MSEAEVVNYIRTSTIPITEVGDNLGSGFKWLSDEIYLGKAPLRANSVHFIIVKIPTKRAYSLDLAGRDYFNVYVVGEFKKSFTPVLRVAEALGAFYSEMGVLPVIKPLPKFLLKRDKELLYKLKNGVIIYERR